MISCMDPLYIQQACRIFQFFDRATDFSIRPTILELELAVSADYSQMMESESRIMGDSEIENWCN